MKKFAADWGESRKLHDRIKAKVEEQKMKGGQITPKQTTPRRVSSRVV